MGMELVSLGIGVYHHIYYSVGSHGLDVDREQILLEDNEQLDDHRILLLCDAAAVGSLEDAVVGNLTDAVEGTADAKVGTADVMVESHLAIEDRRRVVEVGSLAAEDDSLLVVVEESLAVVHNLVVKEGIGQVGTILEQVMVDTVLKVAHHSQVMELLDILEEAHRSLVVVDLDSQVILPAVADISLADIIVDLEYLLGSLAYLKFN